MAANLEPEGAYPELLEPAASPMAGGGPAPLPPTRAQRVKALDRDEPHIQFVTSIPC